MKKSKSNDNQTSTTKVIASSGSFKIELIDKIAAQDNDDLIEISKTLEKEYARYKNDRIVRSKGVGAKIKKKKIKKKKKVKV